MLTRPDATRVETTPHEAYHSIAALLAALPFAASAAPIVLDFEGVNATYPSTNYAFVEGFYDGSTSTDGTSGTDFGISFSSNAQAICLNTPGNICSNTSRGGLGNPNSQQGALFFLSGSETFMNVAAGLDTGFSFFDTVPFDPAFVNVYDGLNGTGTMLATLDLPTTPSTCDPSLGSFCPFVDAGVGFTGTALSVGFGGVANQVAFDDVTFGSVTPDPNVIPVPASLPLLAAALGGFAWLRRRAA